MTRGHVKWNPRTEHTTRLTVPPQKQVAVYILLILFSTLPRSPARVRLLHGLPPFVARVSGAATGTPRAGSGLPCCGASDLKPLARSVDTTQQGRGGTRPTMQRKLLPPLCTGLGGAYEHGERARAAPWSWNMLCAVRVGRNI
jgi:hypothetical protein